MHVKCLIAAQLIVLVIITVIIIMICKFYIFNILALCEII